MAEPRVVLSGLAFGESVRWRDGRAYVADWAARDVLAVDDAGRRA